MSQLRDPESVEVVGLLPVERKLLLELLGGLSPDDWQLPTECPAWSVKGIATHLLGDDLSLLSRQRDSVPSLVWPSADGSGWEGLFGSLDEFNERWVDIGDFLSPAVLIDLLERVGEWTHRWYATVDPERVGEPVHWISQDPSPYWLLAAREYLERWIHHQQIRRALKRPPLDDPSFVAPAVAVSAHGFPSGLSVLPAERDTAVTLLLAGADRSWTFLRGETEWTLREGVPSGPDVRLTVDVPSAALLFSRGLERAAVASHLQIGGDVQLGEALSAGIAAFFGR